MRFEPRYAFVATGAACCLALAACNGTGADDAAPEPTPTPAASPTASITTAPEQQASIMRPDLEPPADVPAKPIDLTIGFPDGGAKLSDDASDTLRALVGSPELQLGGPIALRGHSDAGGSGSTNERVSLRRAQAVRDWLTKNGVAKDRIRMIAFGEQNPVQPNAQPDGTANEPGRAANRRVEIHVAVPEGALLPPTAQRFHEPDPLRPDTSATDAATPNPGPQPGTTATSR